MKPERPSRASPSLAFAAFSLFAACARPGPPAPIDTRGEVLPAHVLALDSLDLMASAHGDPRAWPAHTAGGNPLRVGGVAFPRGVGTIADTAITLALRGAALRLVAEVGVDDESVCAELGAEARTAKARFRVLTDERVAIETGSMRAGDPPQRLDVDLKGVQVLRLVAENPGGAGAAHVDWGGAAVVLQSARSWRPSITSVVSLTGAGTAAFTARAATPASNQLTVEQIRHIETGRGPQFGAWLENLGGRLVEYRPPDAGAPDAAPSFRRRSDGQPLVLGGRRYPRGFSVRGDSAFSVNLGDDARGFVARVGVDGAFDCAKTAPGAGASFSVWVDEQPAWDSGHLRPRDAPVNLRVDLAAKFPGARRMTLVTRMRGGQAINATWAGAVIELGSKDAKWPSLYPGGP